MAPPAIREAEPVPLHVWLFLSGLVMSLFSGFSSYLGLPVGLDRPLIFLAVVLLLLDPTTERLRARPVHAAMALTVGWTAWSWMTTGSLTDSDKAFALADRIVVPFLMFCVGPLIFNTRARRDLLLKLLVLMTFYLAWVGVMQVAGYTSLVWPSYVGDPDVGINEGRATGPFGGSEPYGMAMTIALIASGVAVWRFRSAWRWCAAAASVAAATGVLLSMTRSSWLAAIVSVVCAGILVPRLRRYLPVLLLGIAAGLAAVLVSLPSLRSTLVERLTTDRSLLDRLNTNEGAFRILHDHPVFGVGWGRFLSVSSDWVRQGDLFPLTNTNIEVHNVFLSRAAETGILGAVLWGLAVLLGPVSVLAHRPRSQELQAWRLLALAGLIAWFIPTMTSPNPYVLPNNLVWLVAGIAGRPLLVRLVRPPGGLGDESGRLPVVSGKDL